MEIDCLDIREIENVISFKMTNCSLNFRMVYDVDEVDFCSESDPKILFIVLTKAKEEDQRKIVRETW
jgi:hypothetical protein